MCKNQMTREQFETMSFEELMEWASENLDCVTYEDTLIQFAVEKIESDNLGLALHILNAIYNNPYDIELYRYDYSMGTLEKPTPIADKEDIEDLIDFVDLKGCQIVLAPRRIIILDGNSENISFAGLKTVLNEFDNNGRYAKCGNWSIANGGYDCWWEIYYQGYTVLQCVKGELKAGFRPTVEFTEEIEKQLIERVKGIYADLK